METIWDHEIKKAYRSCWSDNKDIKAGSRKQQILFKDQKKWGNFQPTNVWREINPFDDYIIPNTDQIKRKKYLLGFLKDMNKKKMVFLIFLGVSWILLENTTLFGICVKITWISILSSNVWLIFQGRVVTRHKSSKYLTYK